MGVGWPVQSHSMMEQTAVPSRPWPRNFVSKIHFYLQYVCVPGFNKSFPGTAICYLPGLNDSRSPSNEPWGTIKTSTSDSEPDTVRQVKIFTGTTQVEVLLTTPLAHVM